jgi:hypothetical protein
MRLPVQAQPVTRNVSATKLTDNDGMLPSWNSWIKKRIRVARTTLQDPGSYTPCKIACRAKQAADTAACGGNPICIALATKRGEDCYMGC